jgi:glutamine synthetase
LGIRFGELIEAADWLMIYKYCIKNVAKKYGKTVTFMPKPLFNDNGSGMHTHQSIWNNGQPTFAGDKYAGLSQTCPVVHRRYPQACSGPAGLHQPHHQLLQASGAWV